jgi:hypothetical protein
MIAGTALCSLLCFVLIHSDDGVTLCHNCEVPQSLLLESFKTKYGRTCADSHKVKTVHLHAWVRNLYESSLFLFLLLFLLSFK